jgi:hypothetical protein
MFTIPEETVAILRQDLKAAEIPYKDAQNKVADFHALRRTSITMVVRSGANEKLAQDLARHSTPSLTIGRYPHVGLEDRSAVLSALPPMISQGSTTAGNSAGTDPSVTSDGPKRAAPARRSGGETGRDVTQTGEMTAEPTSAEDRHKSSADKQ